jgi:hypothetical protein
MKKAVVLIRDPKQQYEGLRTSLGLLLESVEVKMVVLDHEVVVLAAGKDKDEDAFEEYFDNMGYIDEMDGERYSNNHRNVEKWGFKPATPDVIAALLRDADNVIPF